MHKFPDYKGTEKEAEVVAEFGVDPAEAAAVVERGEDSEYFMNQATDAFRASQAELAEIAAQYATVEEAQEALKKYKEEHVVLCEDSIVRVNIDPKRNRIVVCTVEDILGHYFDSINKAILHMRMDIFPCIRSCLSAGKANLRADISPPWWRQRWDVCCLTKSCRRIWDL